MIEWANITFYDVLSQYSIVAILGYGWGFGQLWFQRLSETATSTN
jgi:hypothetical protein